jgi:GAF domain-containing protein
MSALTRPWKILAERERRVKLICAELNHYVDLKSCLSTVMKHIKALTRCEAVAIRLHDEGDYPYFIYDGFSDSFVATENSLCKKDDKGTPLLCEEGYLLECMCGNIIRARFDGSLPFFTNSGSFWSNNTTSLLTNSSEADRQSSTRNRCNANGYESVALVPIRRRDEIVGLIQINDRQVGKFTADLIEYMEMIGEQIGLAVQNALVYSKLKKALDEIETLRGMIPICCHCKKIRDDSGYWHFVEKYIKKHSAAEFSHSICPECMKEHYSEFKKSC